MTRKTNRLVCLLILGIFFSATGWAEIVIDTIRIENMEKTSLDPSFVRAYTSLRAGQTLEDEAELSATIAKDVDTLRRSERFSYVRAWIEQEGEVLTLVYSVQPRLRLRAIEVVGAEEIGNRKVKTQLELELGDYVDEAIIGEKVRKVEAYCRKNKYPDASVSWNVSMDEKTSAADLRVIVDEGEKLRVKEINFTGTRLLSDSRMARTGRFFKKLIPGKVDSEKQNVRFETKELLKLLNQKTTFWITPWFGAYRPEMIDADMATLKKFFLDRGFLDVTVESPEVENQGRGRLELTYTLSEGEQYRIGTIKFEGVTLFETAELVKQLRLKSGDIASQAAIESAVGSVARYYGNRGYIRTRADRIIKKDPASLAADVLIRVVEGELGYINQIEVRGNEKTRDEVIRRELAVAPGETFHQQKVETSEKRLRNLGFFETVDSSYLPSAGTNTYDLTFDVKEGSMGSLWVGAAFGGAQGLGGIVEVTHGNFDIRRWPPIGDGQKMRIHVEAGSKYNNLEVSFVEPWLFDRRLKLGVDLYHKNYGYYSEFYEQSRTGGRLSITKPINKDVRGTISYSLENFDVYDVSPTAPSEIEKEKGARTKSMLGLSLLYDTRDQFFVPTRGNQSSVSVDFSGGPMGGDTETVSLSVRSSQFWNLWKEHVLNIKGELRTVDSYGSGDVPIFDRLFLGGSRTIRGFDYRDVSPRSADADSNEPIGGKSSYFASTEYTIPLWSKIRGAVFYDLGAVSPDTLDFFDPEINSSYGIGARFDLPMFPLQLDYAFPHLTDKDNEQASPRLNFTLGYTF